MRVNLAAAFVLGLIGTLFFSQYHLLFFAPYLVLTLYKYSRFAALWRAICCGMVIDSLSSSPFFGLTSLNYCLVSWLLYGQTRNFFEDNLSTLPLMTLFYSVLSTLTSAILYLFFFQPLTLTLNWVVTDLMCMPLFDSLFALIILLPFQITSRLHKVIRKRRRAR